MEVPPNDAADVEPSPLGRCGSYELLVELASGGMATVYLGRPAGRDGPLVAIKRPHRHLAKDKTFLSMLVDEARVASAIDHDNVVKVRELGFDSGEPFIVMDYVEGASLADVRRELSAAGRSIDPRVAVRIALDALAGLEAAHALRDPQGRHLGIVHRDVSPHNVLIGCDGRARLTDFGIAKAADRVQVTQTHEVKGKLAYLAPERIDKRRLCTPQSDVFSMAVVLWESIAGRRLFRGEEAIETLQEVMTAPIPSLRKLGAPISQALDDTILRGLERDIERRFATAAEFAGALAQVAGREGTGAPAEVAMLVEALFGERLRVRQEEMRRALDGSDVARVLEVSGLHERPAPTPEILERERRRIESIAPPAPSARYAFGAPESSERRFGSSRMRVAAAVAAALIILSVVIGLVGRRVARGPEPAVRRVVVTLPFMAARVTFDDQSRDVAPPSEVVVFEVLRESGVRHRVTAVAADGTRAEAFVREADGVARPEGDYTIDVLEATDEPTDESTVAPTVAPTVEPSPVVIDLPDDDAPAEPSRAATAPRRAGKHSRAGASKTAKEARPAASSTASATTEPKPIGTVKDGFTRLR